MESEKKINNIQLNEFSFVSTAMERRNDRRIHINWIEKILFIQWINDIIINFIGF